MAVAVKTSRTQVWMENLGEWSWRGSGAAAVEVLPPSGVPTFPPRLERAAGVADAGGAPESWQPQRAIAPWLGSCALLGALAVLCATLVLNGPRSVEGALGIRSAGPASGELAPKDAAASSALANSWQSLPTLKTVSEDAAGGSIETASYASAALHRARSFLVYPPPGFDSTARRYPVLYLLHG